MKKIVLVLMFCFSFVFTFAETLSDKATVSLLSCGSGKELYAQFGHTAIRIYDPTLNIDVAYNYGTFDFSTENFYYKFVKGLTDYQLGLDFTVDFFIRYNERQIPVWEQEINLTKAEKQKIFDALMVNFQPENRFYRYNFVFDNCATRPRDMIESVLGGSIIYPNRHVKNTFRELVGSCVGTDTWTRFALDFVLGSSADVMATPRDRMFLPLELMAYFKDAKRPDGKPLVLRSAKVVQATVEPDTTPFLLKPVAVSFYVLLLVLAVSYWGRDKQLIWLDAILFTLAGLIGLVIFYISFFSIHPIVKGNFNLLWLQPLDLAFVLLLPFKRLRKLLSYYQLLNAVFILVAIAGYVFLPQDFNIAFLPLMLMFFARALFFIRTQRLSTVN